VSELLDRIGREIRERIEAGCAAVLEYERLEAALRALSDAGSQATHAVTGRGQGSVGRRARSARAGKREAAGAAAAAAPGRKRAPRGANRAAVLEVIAERPGVTTRELAAASRVTGGTLYALLRRLTVEGTVEKRELPGGHAGYALTASGAEAQPTDAQPDTATTRARAAPKSHAAAGPAHDRADST
jgi:hypothetical protein